MVDTLPPLIRAAKYGEVGTLRDLLAKGVDPNVQDIEGTTPLMVACERGHTEVVIALLAARSTDVNAKDNMGCTALLWASGGINAYCYPDIIKNLLDAGADVKVKMPRNGRTALKSAAQARANGCEGIRLLILAGADVNWKDNDGYTPLIDAANHGSCDVVELLLASNASVDAKDNKGRTALMHAVNPDFIGESDDHYLQTIRILIENGAAVTAKDKNGHTALQHATDEKIRLRYPNEPFYSAVCELLGEHRAREIRERHIAAEAATISGAVGPDHVKGASADTAAASVKSAGISGGRKWWRFW